MESFNLGSRPEIMVVDEKESSVDSAYFENLVLYEGKFTDANGKDLTVTRQMLYEIAEEYQKQKTEPHPIGSTVRKLFNREPRQRLGKVTLNHNKKDVRELVGKIIDLHIVGDSPPVLFAKMNILEESNIKKVRLGLWDDISLSFSRNKISGKTTINEISYVFDSAVDWAGTVAEVNFSSGAKKENTVSFELSKCINEIEHVRDKKNTIELEIKKLQGLKRVYYNLNKQVELGGLSRADCKRLMKDSETIDLSSQDSFIRAIKTIATSKRNMRGQVTENFNLSAIDHLVDNLHRQTGEKMNKVTIKELASKIVNGVKGEKSDFDFASPLKDKIEKEEKHVENEHTPRFNSQDYSRLCSYGEKKDLTGMMDFLKTIGSDYGFKQEEFNAKEEEHAGAELGSPESNKLQEQIIDLSKKLDETNDTLKNLEKSMIDLASGKTESTQTEEGK